jgi:hypothetical protein
MISLDIEIILGMKGVIGKNTNEAKDMPIAKYATVGAE